MAEAKENEEPKEPDDAKANEPDGGAGAGDGGAQVTDRHGEPGINREKYERDVKERDERIAELEGRIAEAAKTEEARKKLQDEFDAFKAEQADKDVTYELERAGCRNAKAAKALLGDYDGDVKRLKEAAPYLFEAKGATGLPPVGAPAGDADEALDRAFGLKK